MGAGCSLLVASYGLRANLLTLSPSYLLLTVGYGL